MPAPDANGTCLGTLETRHIFGAFCYARHLINLNLAGIATSKYARDCMKLGQSAISPRHPNSLLMGFGASDHFAYPLTSGQFDDQVIMLTPDSG